MTRISDVLQCQEQRRTSSENLSITVGMDSKLLEYGYYENVRVCPFAPPHLGLYGNSGSGKSYMTKGVMGRIALHKECEIVLNDYKGVDFQWLRGSPHFYQYADVSRGLDYVYQRMNERMSGGRSAQYMHPIFLIWDEAAAYLSTLPKKEADEQKQKLGAILMLGRGVSVCCILAMQRPDAEYFNKSRDNIGNHVLLGSPSAESIRMVAPMYKDVIRPQPRGKGYLLTDGKPPRAITVPQIRDMGKLEETVYKALNRPFE